LSTISQVVNPVSSSVALKVTDPDARWYAIRTRSRHEKVAARELEAQGIPVYLPLVLLVTALPVWSAVRPLMDLYGGPKKEIIRHGCSFNADKLTCYCNGKEVFCPDRVRDEEIVVLPWTRAVLAQRTLAD